MGDSADQAGSISLAVRQGDVSGIGLRDHAIVGDEAALLVPDEPGASTLRDLLHVAEAAANVQDSDVDSAILAVVIDLEVGNLFGEIAVERGDFARLRVGIVQGPKGARRPETPDEQA